MVKGLKCSYFFSFGNPPPFIFNRYSPPLLHPTIDNKDSVAGLFYLLLFYQSSSGSASGAISAGEIIQSVPVNEPGIVNFCCRQVSLSAQPFHSLRMYFETTTGLYYINIVVPWLHNLIQINIALIKQYHKPPLLSILLCVIINEKMIACVPGYVSVFGDKIVLTI